MIVRSLDFEFSCASSISLTVKNFLISFDKWYECKFVNSNASVADVLQAGNLLVLFARSSNVFEIEKQLKCEQVNWIDSLLWDNQRVYGLASFVRRYFPNERRFFRGVFFVEMDGKLLAQGEL